jgi:hypothetical protein
MRITIEHLSKFMARLMLTIALLSADSGNVQAVELVVNGSFEGFDRGRPLIEGWDHGAGLGNDTGLGQLDYPILKNGQVQSGILIEPPPGATDPSFSGIVKPEGAGDWFGFRWGWGNGDGVRGSATQILNVTDHTGKSFQLSAWLGSQPGDPDYAIVTLEFFDTPGAMGLPFGEVEFLGNDQVSPFIVGSLNLEGFADPTIPATKDNWTLYRASSEIPTSAQSAAITIRSGVDIYGYVDLVSLQVIPEPATLLLVAACILLLALWRRAGGRRKGTQLSPCNRRTSDGTQRPNHAPRLETW